MTKTCTECGEVFETDHYAHKQCDVCFEKNQLPPGYYRQLRELRDGFFNDCTRDEKEITEENLQAWLWFSCPATMREDCVLAIRSNARWKAVHPPPPQMKAIQWHMAPDGTECCCTAEARRYGCGCR